jgi:hypothetical protein
MNVSQNVLDEHYDRRTENEKASNGGNSCLTCSLTRFDHVTEAFNAGQPTIAVCRHIDRNFARSAKTPVGINSGRNWTAEARLSFIEANCPVSGKWGQNADIITMVSSMTTVTVNASCTLPIIGLYIMIP